MNWADAFELVMDLAGRRTRLLVILFFALMIVFFRHQAMGLVSWVVMQRAHEITDQVRNVLPPATSASASMH